MMSGLAVGMAAVMGAAPVYAATGEDAAVSKEETVYVNANADGSEDQITVSNWLKNAGTEKNLQDESELKDIKNVCYYLANNYSYHTWKLSKGK